MPRKRRRGIKSPGQRSTPEASQATGSNSQPDFIVEPSDPGSVLGLNDSVQLSSPLNYGTPSPLLSYRTPRSVNRSTPIQIRRDIGMEKTVRQFTSVPMVPSSGREESSVEPNVLIWGTDIVISVCKQKFKSFIQNYVGTNVNDAIDNNSNIPRKIYLEQLQKVGSLELPILEVNCAHLEQYDNDMYNQLVCYPQDLIPTLDMVANEIFFTKNPDVALVHQIQIRPFNVARTKHIRDLNPEDIDKLVTISGMVIRASNIIPEMREAFFKCNICQHTISVEVDRGRVNEHNFCLNCNTSFSYCLIHNRCRFTDKQLIKLQEAHTDDMPGGQIPRTISLYAYNDLVDGISPGCRVTVTGIYRAIPVKVNPRLRNIKSVYKTHIDVLHYQKGDSDRLLDEEDNNLFKVTSSRQKTLYKLSERPDLYERLSLAIAPSIYEHDDVKKGILLQLFGGTRKKKKTGRAGFRADLNILLCGDPGTSKSQLLTYVYNLVPKSQYTSGKSSSAVGLTAYIMRDTDSKQLVLQTGALILADNGVCCIDEFDKMDESTRSVLHEVMEQQTFSIAKAGFICQLTTRTSVLAAANPVESRWNKNKTIIENINLPHTLLSRFDLIFLMLDPQNVYHDRKLARHLVSMYYREKEVEENEFMDICLFRDYLRFARENIHPVLNRDACVALADAYVQMRKIACGKGQVGAYPRQLESLIRLAEAHAKMRYSKEVTRDDVKEAVRLHREALKQSATDPISGKIDLNIITTGLSLLARRKRQELSGELRKLLKSKPKSSSFLCTTIFNNIKESCSMVVTKDMFEDALRDLKDEGFISFVGRSSIKLVLD